MWSRRPRRVCWILHCKARPKRYCTVSSAGLQGLHILDSAIDKDISKLDKSCISNPKSEISNWTLPPQTVQFDISDFGFEMQDLSNFEIYSSSEHIERLVFRGRGKHAVDELHVFGVKFPPSAAGILTNMVHIARLWNCEQAWTPS